MPSIYARQIFDDDDDDGCAYYTRDGRCVRYNSNWNSWGRWIVLSVLIALGFLIFFLFACITARRRRRAGFAPYRGTGWAGGRAPPGPAPYAASQPYYAGNQPNQQPPQAPAPPYTPSNQGYYGTSNGNQGYFGGQQTGVELQPPQNTHQPTRGGEAVYEPPPGPPPKK